MTRTDPGAPDGAAAPGTTISDVAMLDPHGAPTSLHAAMARQPAVIIVYRGAWCPYCNLALQTYREQLHPSLAEQGITLVAVSPQKPGGSLSMPEKHDGLHLEELNADGTDTLPMPTAVLVDAEHRIRWIDIHPDHTTRTDPADILAAVDTWL